MAFIHGWRLFQFTRCQKTDHPVLQGMSNMHLHSRVQKAAECKGISAAMWATQTARDRLAAKSGNAPYVPHEGPSPDWDCTCGHYGYRTLKDAWASPTNAYAHVTCLERTILHKSGWRTTQYSLDYLLAPTQPYQKVYLQLENPSQAQAQGGKVVPIPMGGPWGYYGAMVSAEEREYDQVLEEISSALGVPILVKEDIRGCPDCLIANSWRDEREITEKMRRDWYGEGYKRHDIDTRQRLGEGD